MSRGPNNLLDQIGRHIPLPLPIPDWSRPIILGLLLLATGLALRTRRAAGRVRRLSLEQQELAADLSSMQAALVPEIPPQMGGLRVSVAYRPADGPAAGGDFYDVFTLRSGRVAIILGDASGHGRAALAQATQMHFTLRAYVEAGLSPGEALRLAGRVLAAEEDDLFTTVAIAVYDPEAGSLTYATSGHPHPLTFGQPAPEAAMSCASPPLGWRATTLWRETTMPFPRGARACFFTDGLPEARTEEGLLGRRRLGQIFFELGPAAAAADLLDRVRSESAETKDDMAACVIEALSGVATTDTLVDEVEVGPDPLTLQRVGRFLQDCELLPYEITSVLAEARAIASQHGFALVTVRRTPNESMATASAPGRTAAVALPDGSEGSEMPTGLRPLDSPSPVPA